MKNKSIRIPAFVVVLLIVAIIIGISFIKKQNNSAVEKTAEFKVSDITAKAGEKITISIKMLENSNFVAGNFEFTYDSSKMEYVKYEEGNILKDGAMSLVNHDEENDKISIAYIANPQDNESTVEKGDLVNLTFKIKKSVTNKEITPELKCTTLKKSNGEDVKSIINQGKITID